MFRYLRKNNYRIIIIASVLLISIWGMYLRFEYRANDPLSGDEKRQLSEMGSFSDIIGGAHRWSQFAGDHLLVSPFYRLFGYNKWGVAIPKIFVAILGFYLFFILCRKYCKTPWGYIIAFVLFAANYNLVRHAFEIRPYGVLAVLNIANFLVMGYIFENDKPVLVKRILICVFIFISLLYHTFASLMLFSCYIYHLLASRKGRSIRNVLLSHLKHYGAAVLVALPIWYKFATCYPRLFQRMDVFEYCGRGVSSVLSCVVGNLTGPRKYYLLLIGIIISFLLPHKERFKQIMFLIVLILVPIAIVFSQCLHCEYWFVQRLFIWAMPLFAFFIGWTWDSTIIYCKKNVMNEIRSKPIFAIVISFMVLIVARVMYMGIMKRSIIFGVISGILGACIWVLVYLKVGKDKRMSNAS